MTRTTVEQDSAGVQQDRINAEVFHAPSIAKEYSVRGLDIQESVALLKYHNDVVGKDVLDIGIGAGRTTRILLPVVRRYVGVDYSEPMVRHVRETLPQVDAHRADMRQLGAWPAGSFDMVFASNNVFDAVVHADRLQTLREMHRVLRPGGLLMFSAHNRGAPSVMSQLQPSLHYSRNPLTQIRYLRHFRLQQRNARRLAPLQVTTPEYTILSDAGAHDCALLLYFIDRPNQQRQLEGHGFTLLDVIDRDGQLLAPHETGELSSGLFYVARRNA
jgi:SAM-dependent methyltransferase